MRKLLTIMGLLSTLFTTAAHADFKVICEKGSASISLGQGYQGLDGAVIRLNKKIKEMGVTQVSAPAVTFEQYADSTPHPYIQKFYDVNLCVTVTLNEKIKGMQQ